MKPLNNIKTYFKKMTAIKAKHLLNNRQSKHIFKNEATRTAEKLQWIIEDFVEQIFDSPEKFKYLVIYQHYHDIWNQTCNQLNKEKFKMIQIDAEFFAREYSPNQLKIRIK